MNELYEKMGVFNIQLNKHQALEDLDILKYILLTAYSEMETIIDKGFNIEECFGNLRNIISKYESINAKDFFNQIVNALTDIKDFHLVFLNPYFNSVHTFCQHSQIYFSDIYVTKTETGKYNVYNSNIEELENGTELEVDGDFIFPALSNNGNKLYILGKMSAIPINSITLTILNKPIQIPLHECKVKDLSNNKSLYSMYKVKDFDVVKCTGLTYFTNEGYKLLMEFAKYGEELRHSKGIILDLRGNGGGDSHIAVDFIKNLNTICDYNFEYKKLNSLPSRLSELTMNSYENSVLQLKREECYSNIQSQWETIENGVIEKGTYNNPFIILTDAETASSAEIFIKLCKNYLSNCIITGENTKGCLNTGDIRYFYLPNSLTFLNIPTAKFPNIFEEGIGFIPDYWIDNYDPITCIVNWLEGGSSK
ncbi:MAG: S41 family peptidase [Oscillospiraceae bacterium]|nr:S41 family peptidase [Oscillospiraceae bacterium]